MTAWECVVDATDPSVSVHPRAVDVIQALVNGAEDGIDDVALVGCGPLEELLQGEHGGELLDDIERRARQQPKFRVAVAAVWMGDEVPPEARSRLTQFGASDLTA
jgi:Family of unknown function (DUF6869)